jgi:hypothetical protein
MYPPGAKRARANPATGGTTDGGLFENLRVTEDITQSELQQGKGRRVSIGF